MSELGPKRECLRIDPSAVRPVNIHKALPSLCLCGDSSIIYLEVLRAIKNMNNAKVVIEVGKYQQTRDNGYLECAGPGVHDRVDFMRLPTPPGGASAHSRLYRQIYTSIYIHTETDQSIAGTSLRKSSLCWFEMSQAEGSAVFSYGITIYHSITAQRYFIHDFYLLFHGLILFLSLPVRSGPQYPKPLPGSR